MEQGQDSSRVLETPGAHALALSYGGEGDVGGRSAGRAAIDLHDLAAIIEEPLLCRMDSKAGTMQSFAKPPDGRLALVAITDPHIAPWGALVERSRSALDAGLRCVLLRDPERDDADLLGSALELRRATAERGALLLVNRRIALAQAIGADGVHLGIRGPQIGEARALLGAGALIGYSAHSVSEAEAALAQGADYVFLSPIHPPRSKQGFLAPLGPEMLGRIRGSAIALGGISAGNAAEAIRCGAIGVAAITEIYACPDPRPAVQALLAAIRQGFELRG